MKKSVKAVLFALALAVSIPLTGCQDKGPAEKAGKKVDSAIEKARETAHELSEKVGHEVEDAMK